MEPHFFVHLGPSQKSRTKIQNQLAELSLKTRDLYYQNTNLQIPSTKHPLQANPKLGTGTTKMVMTYSLLLGR